MKGAVCIALVAIVLAAGTAAQTARLLRADGTQRWRGQVLRSSWLLLILQRLTGATTTVAELG